MLSHYCKTALQYLSTHKVSTAINLFGLVTGISVCFFALQYVRLVTDVQAVFGLGLSKCLRPAWT